MCLGQLSKTTTAHVIGSKEARKLEENTAGQIQGKGAPPAKMPGTPLHVHHCGEAAPNTPPTLMGKGPLAIIPHASGATSNNSRPKELKEGMARRRNHVTQRNQEIANKFQQAGNDIKQLSDETKAWHRSLEASVANLEENARRAPVSQESSRAHA